MHDLESKRPRNIVCPHSAVDKWTRKSRNGLFFFGITPITIKYSLWRNERQTIASLDVHLLIAIREGEVSYYSNLIDEVLGNQNIRHIALTFHPLDQKAWHKKALKCRIFSKLPSSWKGFYLASLELNKTIINTICEKTLSFSKYKDILKNSYECQRKGKI